MNRRSFLKTIFVASVSLAVAPTDFLTPYSPPEQYRNLMKEELREVLSNDFYKFVQYMYEVELPHLKRMTHHWDKYYPKFLKEE